MKRMITHLEAVVGALLLSISAANAQEGAALVKQIYSQCIGTVDKAMRDQGSAPPKTMQLYCACVAGAGVVKSEVEVSDAVLTRVVAACKGDSK
jgi:hypothetical protein